MTLNALSPTTSSGLLIGDTTQVGAQSPFDTTVRPTKVLVGGVSTPVCAIAEFQSTDGCVLLPRMTQAQVDALPPTGFALTAGMQVFNTDTNSVNTYVAAAAPGAAGFVGGVTSTSGTLTAANITGMYAAPVQLAPVAPAGYCIVVDKFILNYVFAVDFAGGGAISLEYASVAHAAGVLATGTIAAVELEAGQNTFSVAGGSALAANSTAVSAHGLWISNDTAAFTGGAGSTVKYTIIYRVLPVT